MEESFQNNEFEEDIKQEKEEIGDNKNNNDNNKTNKIVKSLFNSSNIINNKRNYKNFIKKNKLNQCKFNKNQIVNNNLNSINLNYRNKIQNINNILSQTQRINESQNLVFNRNPNLNFNNSPVFNANYYKNQMFTPNYNNFAQLNNCNNLNQSQNIYPNYPQFNNFYPYNSNINNIYSPQFNNFNPYNSIINNNYSPQINNFNPSISYYYYFVQESTKLQKRLIELEKNIYQNQLLVNNQPAFTYFKKNNTFSFLSQKYEEQEYKEQEFIEHKYNEQEDDAKKIEKYKKMIDSIYKRNLLEVNNTLQNIKKVFVSKENLENKEIIIYITNNKTNDLIEKLSDIKAVIFEDLEIPEITYKMIEQKIKNIKYEKTEEDKKLLNDYESNNTLECMIYYNKYMFYSKNKISLFTPHIIRARKNIMSLFLPEELNLSDFLYKDHRKNINEDNDVFLDLLTLRINQFNDYEKKDRKFTDEKYDEKIFGFNKNISGDKFYLYSIMDEEIISERINNYNINTLIENLTGVKSKIDISQKPNAYNCYEIISRNKNILKDLSYEELILYTIINKIEKKYEIFPIILFYEYYLTINGEKVVVSDKIEPPYIKADYAFYSKCDYIYDEEEPLVFQNKYQHDSIYNSLSYDNGYLEIKSNTLYFIELKSSFYLSGFDEAKRLLIYEDFFTKLFNKYKEFIHLYESKNWIKEDTKRELLLIYDDDYIDTEMEDVIDNLLKENRDYTFKIIYTKKSFPFFSHSLAIRKHKQLEKKFEKLEKEYKKREEERIKKIEEFSENKRIKELLDNFDKKNGDQTNSKEENDLKKNEISQNAESQDKEIKNNLINNNRIENSEVSNHGKNNNETKKEEKKKNEN